jgi:tetratricopeptide (TPR) repeat protein
MKNLRVIAISVLMGSTLMACGSSIETAGGYVENGKLLVQEGKLDKARLEFKNAIQIDPRTAEAFYQLALLDEKAQKWKAMYANLTTAEQLDPTRSDASVKLGQIYLLSGDYEQARQKAKKVLDVDPDHTGALVLRASIELKQQNFGLALQDAEKALAVDKQSIEAMSVKAMSYNEQGDSQKALQILEEAISIKPENLSLTMIKLSFLEGQKDYDAVEKVYRQLRQDKPSERWVAASLAKLLNMQDRYDEAKIVLEQFVTEQPEDRDAKLMLVSLVKTREPEQAIILLDQFSAADTTDFDLLFAKIKLQLDNGQTEKALVGLQEIVEKDSEGNNGRKAEMVLANYDFRQGNLEAVEKKLNHVLASAPENEAALILKSRMNIMNGKIDNAVTDLRIVLRNNLESDDAMVLLGQAYLKNGSIELAEDNFRQALSVNPGNRAAALFVADNFMRSDNIERAETVLLAALKDNPKDSALLQVLVKVKIQKKDWAGVENISKTLSEQGNKLAVTLFLDGQVLQGQQQHALAIEKYKAALAEEPRMLDALRGIAYNYVKLGDKAALKSYLQSLIKQDSAYLMAYTMLSELAISEQAWDEVIAITEQGLAVNKQWQQGYLMMASAQQRMGNKAATMATYEKGVSALPEDNVLALRLASTYEGERQFDKAKTLYEVILKRAPDTPVAINNLASLLTDQFRSEQNLQEALKISEVFADSSEPYFMDTYAWVNVQLGHLDKAQLILERVIEKSPDTAVFNYHLGALHYKKAEQALAEKYLKRAETLAHEQGDNDLVAEVAKLLNSN